MLEEKLSSKAYFPFEGESHKGTIMSLPYRIDTWEDGGKKASKAFFEIINIISKYEMVYVLKDEHVKYEISPIIHDNVEIINMNYNDAWSRDTSPIFLRCENGLLGVNFRFNAWGGLYDGLYNDWRLDDELSSKILKHLGYKELYVKDFILEGGSVHSNGNGTIITTKACLLSKGRNNLGLEETERKLKEYLNATRIIWLENGIYNDETNEHVDNICAFIDENTVVLSSPRDTSDIQYKYSEECYKTLREANINVKRIVSPKPLYLTEEEALGIVNDGNSKERLFNDRLAASYINFYQGKDYVIIPSFGIEEDKEALKQFREIFKDKKVYQLNTRSILVAGGNIHCITMQIPRED